MQGLQKGFIKLFRVEVKIQDLQKSRTLFDAGIDKETIEEKTTNFITQNVTAIDFSAAVRATQALFMRGASINLRGEIMAIHFIADVHYEEKDWKPFENTADANNSVGARTSTPPPGILNSVKPV